MTRQRRIILEQLQSCGGHPTADEVFERVRKHLPHISLATVYRNLETMSRLELLNKIESAGRQMRFDADAQDHDHIMCVQCGRVEDVPRTEGEDLEFWAGQATNFEVTGHRMMYRGICPDCGSANRQEKPATS